MPQTSELRLDASSSASFESPRLRIVGRALEAFLAAVAAIAIACALTIAIAAVLGIHPRIEQSGSMSPALEPGDLLFVQSIRATEARPGQILTFPAPGRGIELTHRAVSVSRHANRISFVTRGDANSGVERWSVPANGTIGREVLAVPEAGAAIQWLRGVPLVITVWLAAPFVLLGVLKRIWRNS